jgi:hypothetical protein
MRMVTALFTVLRKLSECGRVLAPLFEVAPRLKRCEDASHVQSAFLHGRKRSAKFSNLCPAADRFERAVFRWSLSH